MADEHCAVDTNIAVMLMNGVPSVVSMFSKYSNVLCPAPVISELYFSAHKSTRTTENIDRIERLLLRCVPLDIDSQAAVHYANVRWELKQSGQMIPMNAIWIAAVCLRHDLPLVTFDTHFERIGRLKLVRP